MKFLIALVIIVLTAMAGASLKIKNSKFDYAAATQAEQEEWLTKQSHAFVRGIRSQIDPYGYNSTHGSGPRVVDTQVDTWMRTITVEIKLPSGAKLTQSRNEMQEALAAEACPNYVRSDMFRNGASYVSIYRKSKNKRVAKLIVSRETCADWIPA